MNEIKESIEDSTNLVDSQSRKWLLTINNPIKKGFSHSQIEEILKGFKSLVYYCGADETGVEGTFHTHLFLAFSSATRFSTLKRKFQGAHFDMARGLCSQNKDYVFKEGKWLNDLKGETNDRNSHFEWGEMPVERQGKRNDLDDLLDMLKSGMTNTEILDENPSYIMQIDRMDKVRQEYLFQRFRNIDRLVNVTYVFGKTGTGKTRDIMQRYGYENVYRVTDYKHPFDNYKGQDVLLLDEYRSNFTISFMLDLLDRYPLELPCRYNNKCACFTKIYIVSNVSLGEQYKNVKNEEKESYNAFLRRIHNIHKYTGETIEKYTMLQYQQRPRFVDCSIEDTPFYAIK